MASDRIRVDPHVKRLDRRVVARARDRGLDAIVYAPHFTRLPEIRARAERFATDDLAVIPGREVFTGSWLNRKHVLAMGLSEPVPDFITLEGAMAALERQDATVLAPHPAYLTFSLAPADLRTYGDLLHGIETYNPKHLGRHNRRARTLRAELSLPAFGSSYAHLRGTVGESWTVFPDVAPTEPAILAALREGAPRSVDHRAGIGHRLRRGAEMGHLIYENSWKKVDRVLLSGREATHPDHPAYGGRFDDVAVY